MLSSFRLDEFSGEEEEEGMQSKEKGGGKEVAFGFWVGGRMRGEKKAFRRKKKCTSGWSFPLSYPFAG